MTVSRAALETAPVVPAPARIRPVRSCRDSRSRGKARVRSASYPGACPAWLPVCLLIGACSGPQSALDPVGPGAAALHEMGIVMYVGAAVVTLLVTVLMLVPVLRPRERRINRNLFLWGGGVALPLVSLSLLVPYVLGVGGDLRAGANPARITVDVTGRLWWWDVSYRTDGGQAAGSANEVRIPAGEPVEVVLRSEDVIHSFWVPNIAGKTDMIPGRVNRVVIQADRPGVYRGQCAEYCGLQHARMAFDVFVLPPAEFDAWLARLAQPAPEPQTAQLRRGRELFLELGCGACHTIRGVSGGELGPDLTRVGARKSLGAGTVPGGIGNIAGWIASSQHLKPGNRMPSYDQLHGEQLRAVAAYLASLE